LTHDAVNVGGAPIVEAEPFTAGPNYTVTFVAGFMTITPAPDVDQDELVVAGLPETVTYGDEPFTLSVTGGSGDGGVTFESSDPSVLSVDAESGEVTVIGAGTATITATKAASTGFNAATASIEVEVAKKLVTVTADDKTKVFGEADPELTFTVDGLVGEDELTAGSLTYDGTAVGEYPIVEDEPFEAGGNYTVTFVAGTMTITPRPVTVTANDHTKVFGEADPELTFTVDGLVGDDELTAGSLTYDGTAVGSYDIVEDEAFAAGANYTVTFTPGTMTITAVPVVDQDELSITGAPDTVTYGDDGFTLATEGGSGDGGVTFESSDPSVLAVNPTTGAVTVIGAGSATITATKAASTGFNAATAQASVTVAKKSVTVTADDQTKVFGTPDPELTFTVAGLVGDDELTAGSLTYDGSAVGSYDIVEDEPFTAGDNYTVTFVAGTMTISAVPVVEPKDQAALSVTGVPATVTAGDGPFMVGTTGGSGTGAVTFTSSNPAVLTVNPATGAVTVVGAGTATITVTKAASDGFNAATASVNVTVGAKPGSDDPGDSDDPNPPAPAVKPSPVFRFFNNATGVHFYSASQSEVDGLRATRNSFDFEGPAYSVFLTPQPGTVPVHRLYNNDTGVHLYTKDPAELEILTTTPGTPFDDEGIAYYAYSSQQPGSIPLYRLYNNDTGTHFYTASQSEAFSLRDTPGSPFDFEGIAYYVLP
jgi:uncharacterized protein YjdB